MKPAPRLGVGVYDIELEKRLRAIEQKLQITNAQGTSALLNEAEYRISIDNLPPTITGLRLVQNVNTITAEWDTSEIGDLSHYNVEVSETIGFAESTTYNAGKINRFTYQEGVGGVTYYIKVRAVTNAGRESLDSSTLDTSTGLATYSNLEQGAATNYGLQTITTATPFSPTDVSISAAGTTSATWGSLTLTTVGGPIIVQGVLNVQYTCTINVDQLKIEIMMDGNSIFDTGYADLISTVSSKLVFYSGLGLPTTPAAGVHVFGLKVTLNKLSGVAPFTVTPQSLSLGVVELRR